MGVLFGPDVLGQRGSSTCTANEPVELPNNCDKIEPRTPRWEISGVPQLATAMR